MEPANDGLTLDQLTIFLAVVEQGSFSAAARHLRRAQSAITYGIQNLELQTGTELFDRSSYRPTLTAAGRVLLPQAQRIVTGVQDYRRQARDLLAGVEARLTLVADVTAPADLVTAALKAFYARFPRVELVLLTRVLDSTFSALQDGTADLGVVIAPPAYRHLEGLDFRTFGELSLVAVAAPDHVLARADRPLAENDLRDHTQLMLSSGTLTGSDHSGFGINRWRIHDLHMRHRLLLAGIGWSSMPGHMIAEDLRQGRLVRLDLDPKAENAFGFRVPLACAHLRSRTLGPAGRWLFQRLMEEGSHRPDHPDAPHGG